MKNQVKDWLKVVFAVAVIAGWFLLALWMILAVLQAGLSDRVCTVDALQHVDCGGYAALLLLLPDTFGNRSRDIFGNVHVRRNHLGMPVFRNPGGYVGRHRR